MPKISIKSIAINVIGDLYLDLDGGSGNIGPVSGHLVNMKAKIAY